MTGDRFRIDSRAFRLLGKRVTEAELEIVFEDLIGYSSVIGLGIEGGLGIGGEMLGLNRRLESRRWLAIDRQFLLQDQVLRLIDIHGDISRRLLKLGLIRLGLIEMGLINCGPNELGLIGPTLVVFSGDRLVDSGVSLDRLHVGAFGLNITVIEGQLVLERHLDRSVEIGVERRLVRRLKDSRLDSRRLGGRGGALVRVRLVVDPEALIQRGRHFLVDGKVVLHGRDFQRTRDRLVEIIVECRVGGRLRRRGRGNSGRGKMGVIRRIVKDEFPFERSGELVVAESGSPVSRRSLGSLLRHRLAFLGNVEVAHQLLFEVDVEVGPIGSLVRGRSLCGRRRLRPDRLTRIETHDAGQFGERIVVGDVIACGYFQLGSVCHYCSRTRTQSDAMDVAQGWPLPAQCGQKVTGFLVKPNAFR
ncbi:MAG: hypothetical protein E5X23_20680 [Mesorhizobium sp.]|nr:MAG: hypothetical protein E5X23_20680 [Mesorhizobium sp.]